MNRYDLQKLAKLRVKEAGVLLDNRCHEGAYYLLGYAIECALKACIAKQTKEFDFPEKKYVADSHTHDLKILLGLSSLKVEHDTYSKQNRNFDVNWTIVKDWNEQVRYNEKITRVKAKDLYSAVTDRKDGILAWIKKYW